MLPFLADEELISISGWKRIAAAFSSVAESTNAEKRDLRIKAKVEDVWAAESDELDCKGTISLKCCVRTTRHGYQAKMEDLGTADSDELN